MDNKTLKFIELAKQKHGNKYDYKFTTYIGATKPITIVCPKHGKQTITACIHLRFTGCPQCSLEAMRKNKTMQADEYIKKAVEVHGNEYDYSMLEDFISTHSANDKIPIICKKHGVFYQDRANHLHGHKCPKCRHEKMFITTEEFIRRSNIVRNYKYDYSKSVYVRNNIKVKIVCPIHGEFEQIPVSHMTQGYGCPKCKIETIANKRRLTMERFLEVSRSVHGDKYDYSKVVLGDVATRRQHVTIICPIHGEFKQQPAKHMDGDNCPKCSGKYQMTTEEFKDVIHSIYGDRYDTSKTVYTRKDGKCIIGCPVHGFVKNSIESLRRGAGCNLCNSSTGENLVSVYLDKVGIKYEREYCINNFGDKNRYRYDFYLPTLNIVIEFHGRQHYEAIDYFGGVEGFKRAQKRDAYKEQLLKKLNIPLLIIKYDKIDVLQTIIAQFINKLFPYEYQGALYPTINRLSKDVHIDPNTPIADIAEQYNSLTYLLKPVS